MALWGNTDQESNKPKFLSTAEKTETFGADTVEVSVDGTDNLARVSVTSRNSFFAEVPAVTFSAPASGTTATGTAVVTNGSVTAINITNIGSGYTTAPTVTINLPRLTIPAANVDTVSGIFTYTANHRLLSSGAPLKYFANGGTPIGGLVEGQFYYARIISLTQFKLYNTLVNAINANPSGAITITSGGNDAQYFEAWDGDNVTYKTTAEATLGSPSKPTHAGWIKRTVGTGGRAGRVHYETLVAMGSITSDANDDTVLPDA